MRIDGIQLREGSQISNLTVASGAAFPSNPNTGELFFRTSTDPAVEGMYMYFEAQWIRVSSEYNLIAPHGNTLPGTGADSQLYFLTSNDANEGLYYWDVTTSSWKPAVAGGGALTFTGDVSGSGAASITLTLATVNSNVGSFGSASVVPVVTVNGKGLVTAVATAAISIGAGQVSSGTFADGRIAQSNVTQHQAALTILESQITDGTILARLASGETISGVWNFTTLPTSSVAPTSGTQFANKTYVDTQDQPRGASTDRVFFENDQTITTSYTLSANKNAMSAGPITIANGAVVTIPNGAYWTIV